MGRLRHIVALAGWLVVTTVPTGCGPGAPLPVLDPLDDGAAFVGNEFTLQLRASASGRGDLYYSFASQDMPDLSKRAQLGRYGDGQSALFRWTPLASDVGTWHVDFTVTGDGGSATETVTIVVKPAPTDGSAPMFRQPLGSGTTLDLSVKKCLDLDVVVTDTDTPHVTLAQEPIAIEGATLTQTGDQTARWHWCPTQAQIDAQTRYALVLSASDGDNPKSIKDYLLVLQRQPAPSCPGAAPLITHTPADVSSLNALTVTAEIADDKGIKAAPLFYYSTTPPANPPVLSSMQQLQMLSLDGTALDGVWGADVPNPVANMPSGSMVTLYYVFVATDSDDPTGACDHSTTSQVYSMKVTNPGGAGGLRACSKCTADSQCGADGDNCITIGQGTYCGRACRINSDCSANYTCSANAITSVDGASARQCVPTDGTCGASTTPTCTEDSYEPNDTLAAAQAKPAISTGTLSSLESCPAADGHNTNEDWYRIVLGGSRNVTVSIAGGTASDLDLQIVDDSGLGQALSNGYTSTESVTKCLAAGTYYARVYSITSPPAANAYTLTYSDGGACTPQVCQDDTFEPDDNATQARVATVQTSAKFVDTARAICSGNDDWYWLYLNAGQTLYASLTFTQLNGMQDLDFHFYDGATDLTPCNDATPCSDAFGQSADSNEYTTRPITHDGIYYLVVHGYNGSENMYDLCVSVQAGQCPVY